MDRRLFLRVAGGGAIVAATPGCSSALPDEAVRAWQGPAAQEADPRRWVLSYALLAPHSHNLQSWSVDLRHPGEIVLYCDRGRLLPQTDPFSRQIMMSHGTFLELLDIAAREPGPEGLRAIEASVSGLAVRVGFAGAAQAPLMERLRAVAAEAWRVELVTPRTVMESSARRRRPVRSHEGARAR